MPHERPARHSLESLKKEAKRWLAALRSNDRDAQARMVRAGVTIGSPPTLRDVQLALAREHGFDGWAGLKQSLSASPAIITEAMSAYEEKARVLLEAYVTGTPQALERHYALTWHRRAWEGMRSYVQLDLGKRPAAPGDDVTITLDDARYLIAMEHGFTNWEELRTHVSHTLAGVTTVAAPVRVLRTPSGDAPPIIVTREWDTALGVLAEHPGSALDANGQMTDAMLERVSRIPQISALRLGHSQALTDAGIRHLARFSGLRELDLSQTGITDEGLRVLHDLPMLESLSLTMTSVTDAGIDHLRDSAALQSLNLMWTSTGDGAVRALSGKTHLAHFWSGNLLTDQGVAALHDLPIFSSWHEGPVRFELLGEHTLPNQLHLRGNIGDRGLQLLQGLHGLFSLSLDGDALPATASGLQSLRSLPHLGALSLDASDDWMPVIAELPVLRFLGVQDTPAGDDGFAALSRSKSIEFIWGRRCANLRTRGFAALSRMPALRGLSVSCLNVDDEGIALLPDFPALRELMPMDLPDAGYRHIGRCTDLEALLLMYCRDTTDAATEHVTRLTKLNRYFNSYTTITDRTPRILSTLSSLEEVTFVACHGLTDDGVAALARLPRLRRLEVSGRGLTRRVVDPFPQSVTVHYSP